MDIETKPSATETAQCIAGMSEKVAVNPLDSDFIAEQTRIFRMPGCLFATSLNYQSLMISGQLVLAMKM